MAISKLKWNHDLAGKAIVVTGGTGSFGKAFVRRVLALDPPISRVVVLSRDELKQYEMAQEPEFQDRRVRFFLGDIRERERLLRAFEDIDVVIHAAALKQVPAAEYNPFEFIKTNVLGGQNVIDCALDRGVERVVALSTDKAAAPINLYGATKLCSDKLFVAANHFKGKRNLKLSVVRYGNVLGSRGSVIPAFLRLREKGTIPITDDRMTRFSITLDEGVHFVLFALHDMWGGEIYVPKIPSYKITDVATAVAPSCSHKVIGIRPGEKLHEEMITTTDASRCFEMENHFVILPSMSMWDEAAYAQEKTGRPTDQARYASDNNLEWLSVDDLRTLVKEHIDPSFEPT
ncbi:MAG: UDP-N-acetylglucosamine 4,6-dehydratase (inverting) [Myxococcota bacterium]